jgi:dipeptidyl aminopeptidase/acylaminoacyl peptidase
MTDPAPRQTPAPFGSWPSPITAELLAGATISLGQIQLRGSDIFWTEGRPQEQGRNVLVQRGTDGTCRDLTPAPFNVRTRAHEYGGGAFVPLADGAVFSHYDDQQLYRVRPAGLPIQLTRDPAQRYADAIIDAPRGRLIAVREDHRPGAADAVATLVAIALDNGDVAVLVDGHDFFSSPALSPDGRQLAWLSWDHPDMPWDGTTLWLADVAVDGTLGPARRVAGGPGESIYQPAWSPRGDLHVVSDRSGWWNLYVLRHDELLPLHPMDAEFGEPQWAFGMALYGFDARGRIVCAIQREAVSELALLDPDSGALTPLPTPYCSIEELRVGADFVVLRGATATQPNAIVRIDLGTLATQVLRASSSAQIDPAWLATAEPIAFPTEGGLTAHAFFYPPTSRDRRGPAGERPPLIVLSHGGPTGSADPGFRWGYQFWTSRGFAVVDVNYGGSSGYGRAYRARLDGQWGVVDVDDSINAARFLIARGDVDGERVVIRGGSAGGYTTLSALTFRRFFKAGASHYGIGDLETLATDTHKFESRYLERLIGPYPAQQALYRARSPVHHTAQLASPMILFQGAEDKAVPPAQAQAMYDAVAAMGLPVAYLLFDGEQHGFRRASTIRRVLEAELYFYGKVFGFTPADAIEPVEIRNLPG